MELNKAETENLKKQISSWLEHQDYELESTFGKGTVDATTFFQVAQRLRSKGLRELSQEDRLTITTPEHVRFTIQSMGVIQQYCRDDTLSGKPFAAMIKDRASADSQIDFKEYEVRVKTRREILMANDEERIRELFSRWPNQKKGFRMMRRWSFEEPDGGIRYDLSIVRSTARSSNGEFKWQRKFTDQDISQAPYLYEVEVELLRKDGDTADIALKRLIKGIGEVLRGIQKSSILIRKSKKDKVLESYKEFVKSSKFLGCYSVTLQQSNFTDVVEDNTPNIRTGYNVTDKADGLRCLGYTDSNGELYLIDMGLNVYRTGLQQKYCRESIIDGEWVTRTRNKEAINQFLAFDIYYAADKSIVSNLPFYDKDTSVKSRHSELKKWIEAFNKGDGPTKLLPYLNSQNTLQISMKTFLFAKPNDMSIFKNAAKVLDTYRIYYTDGVIFTPNSLPLPGYNEEKDTVEAGMTFYSQFKWKPSEDNTIDFLVRFEKMPNNPKEDRVTIGVKPESNETMRYKTLRLYVGSNRSKSFNPRDILLNERKLEGNNSSNKYRAIPFYPKDFYDSMASVCYGEVKLDPATQEEYVATEYNNEPIQDKSIIEMRYEPSMPRGWRWIPLRIRHDKTERFQKGIIERTLNSEKNANGVWNSIHEPITETMIRSGSTQPNENETKASIAKAEARDNVVLKYFERKAPVEDVAFVRGMRDFHNHYIKEIVLYNSTLRGGNKTVLDIACGTGSDIRRWANSRVGFVFGIDYAGDNITNPENGAYAQYANFKERNRREVPPMVFAIGDSSKRIIDGRAGSTDEERDIMRSVFGRYSPIGPIPPYIDHEAAGNLKNGADVLSCMFALHYFFEKKESLDGLLRNIRETLKLGGYFVGCCFDGDSLFNLFKDTPRGGVLTGVEKDAIIWNLRKDYDSDELSHDEDSIGLKINVDFISIGSPHDEYLVSFPYFVERMKENGLELLTENELKEVGLKHSTNLFKESYDMSKQIGKNYIMPDSVKKFSFLNRWFIFRKRKEVSNAEEEGEEDYVPIVNNTRPKSLKVKIADTALPPTEPLSKLNNVVEKEDNVMPVVKELSIEPETKQEERIVEGVKDAVNAVKNARLVERTVPVEKGSAAPTQRLYASNEIINFYIDAALDDKKLKIGDKGAARWLAPSAPFPIKDMDNSAIEYPSIEHFMAGMMYKYGADSAELAQSLFSDNGSIHREFVRKRLLESEALKKAISEDKDLAFLKEESAAVKDATSKSTFKKYKAVYNESKFVSKKDELLQYAVEQRYKKDARLRKILEAARLNSKYLLYYTRSSSSNLSGTHKSDGKIVGDNKLGKLYMSLAGYSM